MWTRSQSTSQRVIDTRRYIPLYPSIFILSVSVFPEKKRFPQCPSPIICACTTRQYQYQYQYQRRVSIKYQRIWSTNRMIGLINRPEKDRRREEGGKKALEVEIQRANRSKVNQNQKRNPSQSYNNHRHRRNSSSAVRYDTMRCDMTRQGRRIRNPNPQIRPDDRPSEVKVGRGS